MITHPFPPLFDAASEKLILGSFPSVRSREQKFYYGFERNRFWQVLAQIFGARVPVTIDEKKDFILSRKLALWDVISSCEINASSDASIKNVIVNDISSLIEKTNIRAVFLNGATAFGFYKKFIGKTVDLPAFKLPSTSPANAACKLNDLIEKWRVIAL